MEYLFSKWREIRERLKNKYLFISLDFDGTLVPIVKTPDRAALPKKIKDLLRRLTNSPKLKLAFISGRALQDIKNKIGIEGVIYSGNHGLEIEGQKINFKPALSSKYRAIIAKIKDGLGLKISSIDGAFVEDKGLSLSLHYRLVKRSQRPLLKTIFYETVAAYVAKGSIKIKPAKMVWEVRPPIEWDKGKAVLWLLSRQAFTLPRAKIFPVYIGDDVTDEDAFKALKGKGLTVFVGRPKNSYADYYLRNTGEVVSFLRFISELKPN